MKCKGFEPVARSGDGLNDLVRGRARAIGHLSVQEGTLEGACANWDSEETRGDGVFGFLSLQLYTHEHKLHINLSIIVGQARRCRGCQWSIGWRL
jgi:hypothetical protein